MLYYRIRAAERAALEGRVSDAYARAPQLVALDERRQRLVADVGAGRISAAEGSQMLDDLSCQEQGILERLGLPLSMRKMPRYGLCRRRCQSAVRLPIAKKGKHGERGGHQRARNL